MERAKAIRKVLKEELGLNARKVSVTTSLGATSEAINVTVKVPIPLDAVEKCCGKFEQIDRCEATREILGGGNTYVFVRYGEGVLEQLYDRAVIEAMEPGDELTEDGVILHKMEGRKYTIINAADPACGKVVDPWNQNVGAMWVRERLGATHARFH